VGLWSRIAGPDLSRRSRALEVRGGVLWVGVDNAAWAAQLSFLRTELLERLQAEGATVSAIQFRLGRSGRGSGGDEAEAPAHRLPPAQPAERSVAEALAAPIADPRLAEAWRALVETGLRRTRARSQESGG
jgi:hypothetical protein